MFYFAAHRLFVFCSAPSISFYLIEEITNLFGFRTLFKC